jgi:hypothetical protein
MNVKPDTPAYKRAVMYWGERVRTTVKGKSVSVHLQTTLKLDVPKMLPWAEVTAVSLEFGTYPAKEVFWAIRNENWLHHYGGENHPDAKKITRFLPGYRGLEVKSLATEQRGCHTGFTPFKMIGINVVHLTNGSIQKV